MNEWNPTSPKVPTGPKSENLSPSSDTSLVNFQGSEVVSDGEPKVRGKKLKLMQKEFLREKFLNKNARPGVHEAIMILDHLKPDFNVGKIFRSADAFGLREVWLVGVPLFHPGPAMGSFRHVPARFFENFEECYRELVAQEYTAFVFEPNGGDRLFEAEFPKKSAFIMGHEEYGVSFKKEDFPAIKIITVPQFGKVQSLNVSVAASIAMYEYIRQTALISPN